MATFSSSYAYFKDWDGRIWKGALSFISPLLLMTLFLAPVSTRTFTNSRDVSLDDRTFWRLVTERRVLELHLPDLPLQVGTSVSRNRRLWTITRELAEATVSITLNLVSASRWSSVIVERVSSLNLVAVIAKWYCLTEGLSWAIRSLLVNVCIFFNSSPDSLKLLLSTCLCMVWSRWFFLYGVN